MRTRAVRTKGGWRLDGTKVWTSFAHRAHYMIALCRTAPPGADRHEGLSQFLIDLRNDGVDIRPIANLAGRHDFNECVFEGVEIPADRLIGREGEGWRQVVSELAWERSGPERFLSTFHLFTALVDLAGTEPEPRIAESIGRLAARLWSIRAMSLAVAARLQQGDAPDVEAALVKDLGTEFEREVVETLRLAAPLEAEHGDVPPGLASSLGAALLYLPSYTLRGGTNEVLRIVAARGLRRMGSR